MNVGGIIASSLTLTNSLTNLRGCPPNQYNLICGPNYVLHPNIKVLAVKLIASIFVHWTTNTTIQSLNHTLMYYCSMDGYMLIMHMIPDSNSKFAQCETV